MPKSAMFITRLSRWITILLQFGFFLILLYGIYIGIYINLPKQLFIGGKIASQVIYAIIIAPIIIILSILIAIYQKKIFMINHRQIIPIFVILGSITMALYIPYLSTPYRLEQVVKAEFASVWGDDWETKISKPKEGPWLNTPYSFGVLMGDLPYKKSDFIFINDTEYLRIGNDSFRFDAYIPSKSGIFPAIINIHGGGWVGGDKSWDIRYRMEYLAAAGYVIFNINYGAIQEFNINRQYNMTEICANIAKFTDWLAENATLELYKANLSQTFLMGLSAGGHLSALLAVARNTVSNWNPLVKVIGGIHYYPPVNFLNTTQNLYGTILNMSVINATLEEDPALWAKYSPITYVYANSTSSDLVPNLIFQGELDSIVSTKEVREFARVCDEKGIKSVYIEVPKADHVFEGNYRYYGGQMTLWAMERFCQLALSL